MRELLAAFSAELRGNDLEAGNRAADLLDALPVTGPVGGGLSTHALRRRAGIH